MIRLDSHRIIALFVLGIGVAAVAGAFHLPALAAQTYQQQIVPMITGTCATSTACDQQTNTSNGPGFKGISAAGNGTVGQTEFKSTSPSNFHAGVLGQDISTSGSFDAGVFGKSSSGVGVEGTSLNGIGAQGSSTNYVGVNAVGGGGNSAGTIGYPALSVVGGPNVKGLLMTACYSDSNSPCLGNSFSRIFTFDTSGNLSISGEMFTTGTCETGCVARDGTARRVDSYADHQTVPSMEDFGEARLANGRAYVPLNEDFANVIDVNAGYLVFITPEGDTNGLYVTQKTHAGFAVRENKNGRSTCSFSYRIVAKPFGENRPRLPVEIRQIGSRS